MLTQLTLRNFKLFEDTAIELGDRVVLVGPNNSGKTSALQALALWSVGVRRWVEKRGSAEVPKERPGVTINRRDLIAVPVPAANLLWRDLHVREVSRESGSQKTRNVTIEIIVNGLDSGQEWSCGMQFDYANSESLYCRSLLAPDGSRAAVPPQAADVRLAYLPPMSGLAANETRLDQGAIDVRIGEGRTAEVLRNLCWMVLERSEDNWKKIVTRMQELFGVRLAEPQYVKERGEVVMSFDTSGGTTLDLSASGRGQQQTLLLLAHMIANPGSVLLLDEPDAHLEMLRQRQIYRVLTETARETNSQIIAATHSEVVLNEAAGQDMVIAFVGRPHRMDERGSQVLKSLRDIGFEHYLQAEQRRWVLYVEGPTDLAILRAFAVKLNHPVAEDLERPFVHYVGNQPARAREHFYGIREAVPAMLGIAIYDRLDSEPASNERLTQMMWKRREIENYLCTPTTLLSWAEHEGQTKHGEIFAHQWSDTMQQSVDEIVGALQTLGSKGDPWGTEIKASDDFLTPLFKRFFESLGQPNTMTKTNFHTLAPYVPADELDSEIRDNLDAIRRVARDAIGAGTPS